MGIGREQRFNRRRPCPICGGYDDAPRGKGHILLFANNPMWRQNTQGSYALVTNAILNWDHLR